MYSGGARVARGKPGQEPAVIPGRGEIKKVLLAQNFTEETIL